jgi:hypothetical protein
MTLASRIIVGVDIVDGRGGTTVGFAGLADSLCQTSPQDRNAGQRLSWCKDLIWERGKDTLQFGERDGTGGARCQHITYSNLRRR